MLRCVIVFALAAISLCGAAKGRSSAVDHDKLPSANGAARELTVDLGTIFPALEGSGVYVAALAGDWRPDDSVFSPQHLWLLSATEAIYRRASPPVAIPTTADSSHKMVLSA